MLFNYGAISKDAWNGTDLNSKERADYIFKLKGRLLETSKIMTQDHFVTLHYQTCEFIFESSGPSRWYLIAAKSDKKKMSKTDLSGSPDVTYDPCLSEFWVLCTLTSTSLPPPPARPHPLTTVIRCSTVGFEKGWGFQGVGGNPTLVNR